MDKSNYNLPFTKLELGACKPECLQRFARWLGVEPKVSAVANKLNRTYWEEVSARASERR